MTEITQLPHSLLEKSHIAKFSKSFSDKLSKQRYSSTECLLETENGPGSAGKERQLFPSKGDKRRTIKIGKRVDFVKYYQRKVYCLVRKKFCEKIPVKQ